MTRFVFVTGGVVSSLGKGLASAVLGSLLQAHGFSVRLRKLDPYLNVDPGTMNPSQHGEVYVTEDGAETDLDLGHYERFTGVPSRRCDNVTAGRIYQCVLEKERYGGYLGETVQVIPHVTDEIKKRILTELMDVDFAICEIGGTVGDIESLPFLEAIRQLGNEMGRENCLFLHLTLMPWLEAAGELKTKPTQHSVKELLSLGIRPDILMIRSSKPISDPAREKISLFCNLHKDRVIPALDAGDIYEIPIAYHEQGLDAQLCNHFNIKFDSQKIDLTIWHQINKTLRDPEGEITIGLVGKYINQADNYKSLVEALKHGGLANKVKVNLQWIAAEGIAAEGVTLEEAKKHLGSINGIIVAGGFGERGAEGKILATQYAREQKIPYFGICFGMQLAVIETARHLAGITGADSSEFGPCSEPVVGLLTEWHDHGKKQQRDGSYPLGGTMRVGAYDCNLKSDSQVAKIYGSVLHIRERHRHRYEVNPKYRDQLEAAGLKFVGRSPDGQLIEIVERSDHPWFIGVQFHPELTSRPFDPHPLFSDFIAAAMRHSRIKEWE